MDGRRMPHRVGPIARRQMPRKDELIMATLNEVAQALSFSLAEPLERFCGNEMLYTRFLKKFIADTTYAELAQAMQDADAETILRAAHTLKGVSANLGLNALTAASAEMVSAVRNDVPADAPEMQALFDALKAIYETTIEVLETLA